MRIVVSALALVGVILTPAAGAVGAEAGVEPALSFGVVPQQSATKLARLWTPILRYLTEQTGYRLQFKTARDIPTFERRLARGDYDLAYMNPYHYTVFAEHPGYRVFGKQKDTRIRGIIVVRRDSPYRTIRELAGQTLAFPAPAAFAASVLPRAEFRKAGIDIQAKYVSSHDSVYRAVAKGLYPAGGGIMRTLENVDPQVRQQLRVLWTTKPHTPHAIAAHKRVPAGVVERLAAAMFAMDRNPEGRALLAAINFDGIEPAKDRDYADIRSLGITLLDFSARPE